MKVTVINGQSHKGSTWNMGHMLAKQLASTDEITEFFLPTDLPHFCHGCTKCIVESEEKCPHYNEVSVIAKAMEDADIIIFTTPVYVFHTTGSMKAFLDHFAYQWMVHRPNPTMFSKQAVILSTAAGAGIKSAMKDISDSLKFWGVAKIYKYGVPVASTSWDRVREGKKYNIKLALKKIAKSINKKNGNVKPSFTIKVIFFFMRLMQKKSFNAIDSKYWKNNGWLGNARPWQS